MRLSIRASDVINLQDYKNKIKTQNTNLYHQIDANLETLMFAVQMYQDDLMDNEELLDSLRETIQNLETLFATT